MTDIDLHAMRARLGAGIANPAIRADVSALLARLAEVEAERDAARKERDRALELADPPGLDAAIEAAVHAAQESLAETGFEPSPWRVIKAVRAAAPALRAGALREAADDARYAELIGGFIWAGWLRERADRIGGAT